MTIAKRTSIAHAILAALAALALATWLPSGASAATLGSTRVATPSQGGQFCGGFDSCALMQKSLPGAITRAPFSGTVRSWRVNIDSGGSIQFLVLRKHSDGSFSAVRASGVKVPETSGVHRYRAKLKIAKGEFIGLNLLDQDVTIHTLDGPEAAFVDTFKPDFGTSPRQSPYAPFSTGLTELELNARVTR